MAPRSQWAHLCSRSIHMPTPFCWHHAFVLTFYRYFCYPHFCLSSLLYLILVILIGHVDTIPGPMILNKKLPWTVDWASLPVQLSNTSVQRVWRESGKQLSSIPLNSFKQGKSWQRPFIEIRHMKKKLWVDSGEPEEVDDLRCPLKHFSTWIPSVLFHPNNNNNNSNNNNIQHIF